MCCVLFLCTSQTFGSRVEVASFGSLGHKVESLADQGLSGLLAQPVIHIETVQSRLRPFLGWLGL